MRETYTLPPYSVRGSLTSKRTQGRWTYCTLQRGWRVGTDDYLREKVDHEVSHLRHSGKQNKLKLKLRILFLMKAKISKLYGWATSNFLLTRVRRRLWAKSVSRTRSHPHTACSIIIKNSITNFRTQYSQLSTSLNIFCILILYSYKTWAIGDFIK